MNNYLDQVREVFFINNGETDLLTGSSAPNLFNQLVKRDIQLASRNNARLSIISLSVCLDRFVLALGHICHRQINQNQLDWYSKIDELHFKSNLK